MIKFGKIDINKLIQYSLIVIGLLYFTHCGKTKEVAVIPEDYISPREFDYRMQVIELIKETQKLEYEIHTFKTKYENDTINIHNASFAVAKSMFSEYLKKR